MLYCVQEVDMDLDVRVFQVALESQVHPLVLPCQVPYCLSVRVAQEVHPGPVRIIMTSIRTQQHIFKKFQIIISSTVYDAKKG